MKPVKKTKIIATVSDLKCDVEFIEKLYKSGVNLVRMNSAHIQKEGLERIVNNVRKVSPNIGLILDTKGPEIRTTKIDGEPISFKTGEKIYLKGDANGVTTKECIYLSYPNFTEEMKINQHIFIDDGIIDLKVQGKEGDKLVCIFMNDGILGSKKSVNVPNVRINLPSITERDRMFIRYAMELNIDFIAHSFVRNKEDVLAVQNILDEQKSNIGIIAKIENQEGIDNIDSILEATYGVMVARGDLGIEVAEEKIPNIQRNLIRRCILAKKPVIVATQMLHSMITNPRPTRAEVTDVANAIFYRADALMLSGETANGKYPIEAVETMSKIIIEAEKSTIPEDSLSVPLEDDLDVTTFLAEQAVNATSKLGCKAILTDSFSGRTARYLSAYRGNAFIYSICYKEHLIRKLVLSYGIYPFYQESLSSSSRDYYFRALKDLLAKKYIKKDDMIAYLSGNFKESGNTFLELNIVGQILNSNFSENLPL